MEIESIKTWQWMLIGLIAGALFSAILAAAGPAFDSQPRDTIEQGEFENGAMALTKFGAVTGPMTRYIQKYHKGQALLKDVTVHPPMASDPLHRYWVTGRSYSVGIKPVDPTKPGSPAKVFEEWKPFKYPATVPYSPGYTIREQKKLEKNITNYQKARNAELAELKNALGGQATFPTVVEYLKSVSALPNSEFTFKLAWWEKPLFAWTLPPLAGLLMIGIAWPLTLSSMQSIGLAKPVPINTVAKPLPEKKLVKPNVVTVPVIVAPAPPPVIEGEERKYGGEFYPVAKTVGKEDATVLTNAKADSKPMKVAVGKPK